MKRLLSLILLVGSFAGAMDAPLMVEKEKKNKEKETVSSDENWFEKLEPIPKLEKML